jgi:sulfite exporter TauE/SafE
MFEPSLLSAFVIGLLHVLEPCEDKAVASVYIAWAGKKLREALLLVGLYGLGIIAINTTLGAISAWLGAVYLEAFQPTLKAFAGAVTIIFGLLIMMKWHRIESHCYIRMFKKIKPTSRAAVLAFGFIRGLPLCPIEVGIILWAAGVGSLLYGAALLFAFSVGTALSLIPFGIGAAGLLTMVRKRAGKAAGQALPALVGIIIITIGLLLLAGIL